MTVFEGYKRVIEVSKDHPELIAEIDEFLDQGRGVAWITGRLNRDLRELDRPMLKPKELESFLYHRSALLKRQKVRKAKGVSKAKRNSASSGDGASTASFEPSQGTAPVQRSAGAVEEDKSVLFDTERRRRTAEKLHNTHEEIVEWAAEVVQDLLQAAKDDPESDAGTVMRILLINQVVANEEKLTEEMVTKLMDEHRKSEQLKGDKVKLEMAKRRLESDLAFARQKTKALTMINKEKEGKLDGVKQALSQRRELSTQQIYDKISAVIGMGDVVIPRVEKGAE